MSAAILPKAWPSSVRSAILQVVSLGQFALARTHGWAANSINARVRLKAQLDRANQEIACVALLDRDLRRGRARFWLSAPPHDAEA